MRGRAASLAAHVRVAWKSHSSFRSVTDPRCRRIKLVPCIDISRGDVRAQGRADIVHRKHLTDENRASVREASSFADVAKRRLFMWLGCVRVR